MNQKDRFKVINLIRNNTNLIRKCQVCGADTHTSIIHTIIDESNHNLVNFVCTNCRYSKENKLDLSKLNKINIQDYIIKNRALVNLDKLEYTEDIDPYIENALTTKEVKTEWLKNNHISEERLLAFIELYNKNYKTDVREAIYNNFTLNMKSVRVRTLNKSNLEYSNNLNKLRIKHNKSLKDLSKDLNYSISDVALSYIERGKYKPKKHTMILISKVFDLHPSDIFPIEWGELNEQESKNKNS